MWSTLIVCLTVLVLFEQFLAPLLERLVALAERKQEPVHQEAVSLPRDLYNLAQSYQDAWAREDAMKAMRELYGESGSWDMVRVRYGIAEAGE